MRIELPAAPSRGRPALLAFVVGTLLPGAARAADGGLFISGRTPVLVALALFGGFFAYHLLRARTTREWSFRSIAGLEAIPGAIRRALQTKRPVLFVTGIEDVDNVQTLAGLSVLSHVAQETAEKGVELFVPNRYGMVMTAAQEVVKESHQRAGRADTFREENVYYVSQEQFALVAHADGLMVRERPAVNFFIGSFYAESLILAETGHAAGAVQIAGTANAHQLPFFVAACDHCLIGEELYAADAYLTRDPRQMATLKGQDALKLILILICVGGIALSTLAGVLPFLEKLPSLFAVSG